MVQFQVQEIARNTMKYLESQIVSGMTFKEVYERMNDYIKY